MSEYFRTLTLGQVFDSYPAHFKSFAFFKSLTLTTAQRSQLFIQVWAAFAICCFVANRAEMKLYDSRGFVFDGVICSFNGSSRISIAIRALVSSFGDYAIATTGNGHLGTSNQSINLSSLGSNYQFYTSTGYKIPFRDLLLSIPYLAINWYNKTTTPLQLLVDWCLLLNSYDRSTQTEYGDFIGTFKVEWGESSDGKKIFFKCLGTPWVSSPLIPSWADFRSDYGNY